jgi:uncharacterized membrane protein
MLTARRWITILAVVGMAASGYLSYTHLSGAPIFCGGSSSCELVNASRYAFLGPIPIALLGLGMYVTIALLSVIPMRADRRWPDQALFGLSLTGALYALYLTAIELFVLHAVCMWCAISAAAILLIFILALPRPAAVL